MRRHLPLTGIILLAALLRLGGLGSRSLWLDEGAE
jgi:predicted membrane-bound mannosyltransferase